jgi:cell wall-associated NlpC family hydrolase
MLTRRLLWLILALTLGLCGLPGAAAPAAETPEYEAYVVHENQTLEAIAAEYGLPAEYLAQFNQLEAKGVLKAGTVIMVPILTQLAPQAAALAQDPDPKAPVGEQISGVLGTVSAAKTQILSKPNGGRLLFDKAVRGTELLVIGQTDAHYAVLMSDGSTGFVPKSALVMTQTRLMVPKPATPAPAETGQNDFVDLALQYLGTPYRYGGTLPNNVDCSLLVQTVFARKGVKLPRTAAQQFGVGTPVSVANLQAGDRLYFYDRNGNIGHTALYMGNGRFVHASSNRGCVAIDELANPSYWKKYAGARR